ncbi:unnamed protein product [Amoebophrya sp. A120]|nr:unnamed protein product [Amoebophrya sp. A120]|eukprot:GSA120T00019690001.1
MEAARQSYNDQVPRTPPAELMGSFRKQAIKAGRRRPSPLVVPELQQGGSSPNVDDPIWFSPLVVPELQQGGSPNVDKDASTSGSHQHAVLRHQGGGVNDNAAAERKRKREAVRAGNNEGAASTSDSACAPESVERRSRSRSAGRPRRSAGGRRAAGGDTDTRRPQGSEERMTGTDGHGTPRGPVADVSTRIPTTGRSRSRSSRSSRPRSLVRGRSCATTSTSRGGPSTRDHQDRRPAREAAATDERPGVLVVDPRPGVRETSGQAHALFQPASADATIAEKLSRGLWRVWFHLMEEQHQTESELSSDVSAANTSGTTAVHLEQRGPAREPAVAAVTGLHPTELQTPASPRTGRGAPAVLDESNPAERTRTRTTARYSHFLLWRGLDLISRLRFVRHKDAEEFRSSDSCAAGEDLSGTPVARPEDRGEGTSHHASTDVVLEEDAAPESRTEDGNKSQTLSWAQRSKPLVDLMRPYVNSVLQLGSIATGAGLRNQPLELIEVGFG